MISRVRLENWKSHHESELTFSGGVNVLVGEMGAGKSSVLEALTFGLFGTTPAIRSNRVNLDEMIRRVPSPADTAVVEVDVELDGSTYTVRREVERDKGVTTSELREDGDLVEAPQTTEVTEEVEELLGIDYDLFARAIYSEQNELDYFLDLRSGERKQKIDELLRLDRFEDARSTLVTVTNRLADRKANREDDRDQLADELDEDAIDELRDRVAEQEDELEELREEKEDVADELEETRAELEELQETRQRADELDRKRTALETRIESLDDRLAELADEAGDLADLDPDGLDERRADIEAEREELAEREDERDELAAAIDTLEDRRERLAEERDDLAGDVERLEELEEVEDELAEAREERETLQERKQQLAARIDDAAETIDQLSGAADECPTCGQELTDDHRESVLSDTRAAKEEHEAELAEVGEGLADIEETIAGLEERRDELVQLKGAADDLAEVEDELDEIDEELGAKRDRLDELEAGLDEDRADELTDALDRIETAEELHELQAERAEREDELAEVADELDDIGFDEEKLDAVRDEAAELERRHDVLETKISDTEELIAERRERLTELERKRETLEKYDEQVRTYRHKLDHLAGLQTALEETQVELRQRFVASVNEVMADVWSRVYPYDDYDTVRLNAQEDYAIELQDADGRWVDVDGQVSGGERHSAALTLRIALALVLAPAWRILLLDEPTHNLDVTTIEDLGETLRTRVADIVDQLFLITHEERLETAATGDLYQLTKQVERSGLTVVQEAPGDLT